MKIIGRVFIGILTAVTVGFANEAKTVQVTDQKEGVKLLMASVYDDKDQPCYAGGKHVGNCSRNRPYYNVLNGECYATLDECKQADGDLSSVSGSGGCVRCGK